MPRTSLFRKGLTVEQKLDILSNFVQKLLKRPSAKNSVKVSHSIVPLKVLEEKGSKLFLPAGTIKDILYRVSFRPNINDKEKQKPLILNIGLQDKDVIATYTSQLCLGVVNASFKREVKKDTFCQFSFEDERITEVDLTILFEMELNTKTLREIKDEGI